MLSNLLLRFVAVGYWQFRHDSHLLLQLCLLVYELRVVAMCVCRLRVLVHLPIYKLLLHEYDLYVMNVCACYMLGKANSLAQCVSSGSHHLECVEYRLLLHFAYIQDM
jgi:hypothetical protein